MTTLLSRWLCAFLIVSMVMRGDLPAQFSFGGYDFPDAQAFADMASEVGSPPAGAGLLPHGTTSVQTALTDINLGTWVIAGGSAGLVDVVFTDNVIVNGAGADFVVFEYGTAETYGVAVSTNGTAGGLTSMLDYSGTQAIDLDDFGIAGQAVVTMIRIQPNKMPGSGVGEWSADIQDIGALHSEGVPDVQPDRFDFNDGTDQGWTSDGAYDEDSDGPFASAFAYLWVENTNFPNPPGNDPLGDQNGSVSIFTMGGHGVTNPGAEWWIMRFLSPDLSGSAAWQASKGYTAEIAECMANMTSVYANLNVKVYDHDEAHVREFYNGLAVELVHDSFNDGEAGWNHLSFSDWTSIANFPENYTIQQLYINIFGKMNGAHTGGLYLDEIVPITDGSASGVPDAPSNLQVRCLTDQFHITWDDNSDDEQGFIIEHQTLQVYPAAWSVLDTLDANITSFQMDSPASILTHYFRIRAFNQNGSSTYAEANAKFLQSLIWIAVDAPDGGETWAPGSIAAITWRSSTISKPSQVNILLSTDGGSHWIDPPVASATANSGSFLWTVPDAPSGNCVIRVEDAADGSPYGLSHDPFTIGGDAMPVLAVPQDTLDFGTSLTSLSFSLSNSGSGTLSWNVSGNPDQPWIVSVTPVSGENSATITVQVDREGLDLNEAEGLLTISSNGGTADIVVLIEKEAQAGLPESWDFRENTGNNAIVILPASVAPNIDGTALVEGDYIGVFTPSGLCCGLAEWPGQNVSVTVWGDDSQTAGQDGFQTGETLQYRVYRPSTDEEWDAVSVAYSQGSGQYAPDAIMILSRFDASALSEISLDFQQGWNMFSVNVNPDDFQVKAVMAPVTDDLVILKDGSGRTFIPAYTIDHIGTLDCRLGYKAFFSQARMLSVTGLPVNPATPIEMSAGWSLIGYLPDRSMDVENAMNEISEKLVIVKDGAGRTYVPDYGINQIGQMGPGYGYQVYITESAVLIYPEADGGIMPKKEGLPPVLAADHFQFTSNTGENATVIIPLDAAPGYSDGSPLNISDEIGIFNAGAMCCGAAVWQGVNTAVTVWGDDSQTDAVDGFQPGDTLYYRIWNKSEDCECEAEAAYQDGISGTYTTDGLYVLTGLVVSPETASDASGAEAIPRVFALMQNQPNPFNPSTAIRFSVPVNCDVRIVIYDILGKEVETLTEGTRTPGTYIVQWNAGSCPNGIYLLRMQAADFVESRKLLLSK
ncbi:T9SS type A sorting domain-containing protein [bacterium]|nr:T9SS type A sorting domain-containing protein [bacterium]